ncbi:MAG: tRNA (adenosine(37)-N6)-threonylcarbamoyltransferase complex ATPase subunit type 1 TsaE [Spirochaetae bacterium HGW-Spirochaetae-8]|nr:MAG: tRNA (adenosine(37)-N6)-threonylcarbamoyltransferase complex ATPase subunit type 1 TsaE [Spirochaetae bacterium HGW-Spirochaetae-8]
MSSTPDTQIHLCRTIEDTLALGKRIGEMCLPGTVISLRGPLGSGKTVIAKGIALALGIMESIVSPTFTLVQEYEGKLPMHHMDLYRIDSIEEFAGIGGEELLYNNGITLIEWSEKIDRILPPQTIYINIAILDDQTRSVSLEGMRI